MYRTGILLYFLLNFSVKLKVLQKKKESTYNMFVYVCKVEQNHVMTGL